MPSHELMKSNILKPCFPSNHVPALVFYVLKPSKWSLKAITYEYKLIMKDIIWPPVADYTIGRITLICSWLSMYNRLQNN